MQIGVLAFESFESHEFSPSNKAKIIILICSENVVLFANPSNAFHFIHFNFYMRRRVVASASLQLLLLLCIMDGSIGFAIDTTSNVFSILSLPPMRRHLAFVEHEFE